MALTRDKKKGHYIVHLPRSTLLRPDVRHFLGPLGTVYFSASAERQAGQEAAKSGRAAKPGVAETWNKMRPDERPRALYLWLQNGRLVFRTKIPDDASRKKSPALEDKVTGDLSKNRVRLWQLNVRILSLEDVLPRAADDRLIERVQAEDLCRRLHAEASPPSRSSLPSQLTAVH